MVDMLFFLVSFLQAAGYPEENWVRIWGSGDEWGQPKRTLLPPVNALLVDESMKCFSLLGMHLLTAESANPPTYLRLDDAATLFRRSCAVIYDRDVLHRAYAAKLIINFERLARGRRQVDDALSDSENLRV
jgi:hypothetical protein